ncbi:uncharacterized protein PODANS_5_6210 [Podospora anserina S mat+]|uniref:Podospora anserina S mat+ genomic DNA chromosome 5, supercontig 6 n=2 Tax=Podospora anserina TaxID=2587412 RepID=B2VLH9_PODAN|nr:uncharacterized protein PODANS_5_6210 [Podospora anserina S mat+]CAD60775.1 unnamed protein product [Podospora anserina]CAP49295.1 unnamed protein product [Podospora anserina S mat+]CDP29599.1 Putative protein of unknown function [Podospora anserina S mat+]
MASSADMASTSYFGRPVAKHRLATDFDLLVKWSRVLGARPENPSCILSQLSKEDQATLFSPSFEQFRIVDDASEGPKIEIVQNKLYERLGVAPMDPDLAAMMVSDNYKRSEKSLYDVACHLRDAEEESGVLYDFCLQKAKNAGWTDYEAHQYAKMYRSRHFVHIVRRRQQEIRDEKRKLTIPGYTPIERDLIPVIEDPLEAASTAGLRSYFAGLPEATSTLASVRLAENGPPASAYAGPTNDLQQTPVSAPTSNVGYMQAARYEYHPSFSPHVTTSVVDQLRLEDIQLYQTPSPVGEHSQANATPFTPSPAPMTTKTSYSGYVSGASDTSMEAQASDNSGQFSDASSAVTEMPVYAADDDDYDDADGGALLPRDLAESLGIPSQIPYSSHVTQQPVFQTMPTVPQGGLLGAGLSGYWLPVYAASDVAEDGNQNSSAFQFPPLNAPVANTECNSPDLVLTTTTQFGDTQLTTFQTPAKGPRNSLSENVKVTQYPESRQQLWNGMTCYDVPSSALGFLKKHQIFPTYWTTKLGKERFLRHKFSDLKHADAKVMRDKTLGKVARNPVYIVVDLSNIIIGFYDKMKEKRGIPLGRRVIAPAFSFNNFDTLLARDRSVRKRILAGSLGSATKSLPSHVKQASAIGYDVNLLHRVSKPVSPRKMRADLQSDTSNDDDDLFTGPMKLGEQGVDEVLHLKLLQLDFDHKPGTICLGTGDAASAEYSDGFLKNIERLLERGWRVELYGWAHNISFAWRDEFETKWADFFKIIELDEFCEELFDMTVESIPDFKPAF